MPEIKLEITDGYPAVTTTVGSGDPTAHNTVGGHVEACHCERGPLDRAKQSERLLYSDLRLDKCVQIASLIAVAGNDTFSHLTTPKEGSVIARNPNILYRDDDAISGHVSRVVVLVKNGHNELCPCIKQNKSGLVIIQALASSDSILRAADNMQGDCSGPVKTDDIFANGLSSCRDTACRVAIKICVSDMFIQ
jgi:hypothetical protein